MSKRKFTEEGLEQLAGYYLEWHEENALEDFLRAWRKNKPGGWLEDMPVKDAIKVIHHIEHWND